MRAILMEQPGEASSLVESVVETPELVAPDQLLIKLEAAGINPIDTKLRANGTYFPDQLPTILGCDGAGRVVEIGASVTNFKVGDEVYFYYGGVGGEEQGNYAEYNRIPEAYLAPKPSTLTFSEAAAIPLALITAWEALHHRAEIREGESLLIHAGAGGVGHLAIQLAKMAGCRVITTVSSKEKELFVRSLGADEVINYQEQSFVDQVLELTEDRGVDVVLDSVGGKVFEQSFEAVRPYGRIVTLLQYPADTDWKQARLKNLTTAMELMLSPAILGLQPQRIEQTKILQQCGEYFDDGRLKVEVAAELSLGEAAKAHQMVEQGGLTGKIVLKV